MTPRALIVAFCTVVAVGGVTHFNNYVMRLPPFTMATMPPGVFGIVAGDVLGRFVPAIVNASWYLATVIRLPEALQW